MYNDATPAASPAEPAGLQELVLKLFPSSKALAGLIDHTLLRPEATEAEVLQLARESAEHRFACAMINPAWVPAVSHALRGTGVRVGTVIGFPLGASLPATKRNEARAAAAAGALDLDMVLPIGALRSGLLDLVEADIRGVAEVAHGEGAILKVILEMALLRDEEKRTGAELCLRAGADFVKTSTGFSSGGATTADVQLLRAAVGERCGVKASGGIRTLAETARMVEAGANRIGASASVAIMAAYGALQQRSFG